MPNVVTMRRAGDACVVSRLWTDGGFADRQSYETYALRTSFAVHDFAGGGTRTLFFLFSASAMLAKERVGSFSSIRRMRERQPKSMLLQ